MIVTSTLPALPTQASKPVVPRGVLGPPAHLAPLAVGTQSLSAARACSISGDAVEFAVARMSSSPACFHVRGLLSEAECDHIVASADTTGMVQATTNGGDGRHNCGVAWLPVERSGRSVPCQTAASIAWWCEQIFLTPEVQAPESWAAGGGSFESMQVLKYQAGGEFKPHLDASSLFTGHGYAGQGDTHRVLTVLLYLNGVGGTWFPLATTDGSDAGAYAAGGDDAAAAPGDEPPSSQLAALTAEYNLLMEAIAAARSRVPGRDGLLASPSKGDAVAFYNYVDDGTGDLDRTALHAGLPAPSERSVGTLWYSLRFE
tara:strand:- start:642 stop:1589 length:948 start_codon:yes stop_codon:yes gene_type:complete